MKRAIRVGLIRENPRVLILTFPPDANANYGGILQAWSLQRTLDTLGVTATVAGVHRGKIGKLRSRLKHAAALGVGALTAGKGIHGARAERLLHLRITEPILRFTKDHIRTRGIFDAEHKVIQRLGDKYEGYVVGSDQIWRPDFVHVPDFMLGFLPADLGVQRVAYAASFGVDSPGYSPKLISESGKLLERFHAISARESSGVDFIRSQWGLETMRLIDPTMLVSPDEFRRLAGISSSNKRRRPEGGAISYILDPSTHNRDTVASIQSTLATPITEVMPAKPVSYPQFVSRPGLYRYPTVGNWLRSISSATFVVTDSFHGCVFSILFNVPFIVLPNRNRGLARFETLLSTFGLEDRLVMRPEAASEIARQDIDWADVNARLEREKRAARDFLADSLRPLLPNQ